MTASLSTPTGDDRAAPLSAAVRLSVMRLARRLRSERADSTLTLTQLSALATLERHGPLTPGELAAHERVQPPSVTRVVALLDERGLLTRRPHPSDGRQQLVEVSPAGRQMLTEDRRRREAWLAQQLAGLDEAERRTLLAAVPLLDRLAES